MDLYRARWIVPVDRDPFEDGGLLVDAGRIVGIGRDLTAPAAMIHDLGDVILLPGFINAHTHLELSGYRGKLSAGPLWDWLEQLIALRRHPDVMEIERQAILDGAAQSLAAGVTCVGDISRTGSNLGLLQASPIRKVCFLELFSGAKQQPNDFASLKRIIDVLGRLVEPGRNIMGISPHAPYSVEWRDLLGAVDLSERNDLPLTMHFLETKDEQQWLADGSGPLKKFLSRYGLPNAQSDEPRTVQDILVISGLLDRNPLFAHVNYADDELISMLSKSRANVVFCPRTHSFFRHAPHRWRDMLAVGINVCIGTDSLASSPSLSILDELRHLRQQSPDADPALLLDMATRRAAVGLGLSNHLGTLSPGKYADFTAISWDAAGPPDPLANIVDGHQKTFGTWIGGRGVWPHPLRGES
jgi:cytosine/adenosine deaminase-related metal-dependent hydrolase